MNFEYGLKDDSDDDGGDGEREEGGFECGLNDDRSDSVGLIIMVRVKDSEDDADYSERRCFQYGLKDESEDDAGNSERRCFEYDLKDDSERRWFEYEFKKIMQMIVKGGLNMLKNDSEDDDDDDSDWVCVSPSLFNDQASTKIMNDLTQRNTRKKTKNELF